MNSQQVRNILGAAVASLGLWGLSASEAGMPLVASVTVDPPLVDVVERVDRSLMFVSAGDVTGSGFLFGDSPVVVTNKHVVADVGLDGEVELRPLESSSDGRVSLGRPLAGVVRVMHPTQDLAVIEVLSPLPRDSRALSPGGSARLLPRGSEVLVHGFPATQVPVVSRGIVSAHHHVFSDDEPMYLVDAASGSGSSGGPMTDVEGRLVGVVSAVYDVPEDLGSTWGFAIPVSQVQELFDQQGRLKSGPAPTSVADLLVRVRQAAVGAARIDALGDGIATILRSRTDLRTLLRDQTDFLERSAAYVTLRDRSESERFMDVLLDLQASGVRRGAELGLGGDEAFDDPAFLVEVAAQELRGRQVGERIMQRALAELGEDQTWYVVAGLLDAVSTRAERAVREISASVERLQPLVMGDLPTIRDSGREQVIEAMTNIGLVQSVMQMGGEIPAVSAADRNLMPRSVRSSWDRFELVMARLRREWMAIPEDVRSLITDEDTGFADADEVRAAMRQEGLQLVEGAVETIRVGPSGAIHRFTIGPRDGLSRLVVLLEAADGTDVDLVLRTPNGDVAGVDEAMDAFPLVVVETPMPGRWTAEIVNAGGVSTTVRVERWSRR
jgi:S1-C subfamily serine protease